MLDPSFDLQPLSSPSPLLTPAPRPRPAVRPRRPAPGAPFLRLVAERRQLPPLLGQRDPDYIRRIFPYIARVADGYFRAEVQGTEHLTDEASLLVSTHNGGMLAPDIFCLSVAYFRRFGIETPIYSMAHKMAFLIPGYGAFARKTGALLAHPDNASVVLQSGFPLLLCPGGDEDNLKPFRQRHVINFAGRMGFIRTAIRHQVPIVPVVSVGAHETFFVLNDGRALARRLRLDRLLRIKTVPVTLGIPGGLFLGGLGHLPLPSKIVVRVLPRVELGEPPAAADDPRRVRACYDHVCRTMQAALTELASRRRWPILG